MKVEPIRYAAGDRQFSGALVYDPAAAKNQPMLLVAPNWLGAGPAAMERGSLLASRGYVVFVVDMYGEGVRPAGPPESAQLADALRADPDAQRLRINAALAASAPRRRSAVSATPAGRRPSASASAAAMCWSWRAPAPISRRWSRCMAI